MSKPLSFKRCINKMYFEDFYHENKIEYKRKYLNDWSDLRSFVGLDDIDLVNNELIFVNTTLYIKSTQSTINIYTSCYDMLNMLGGGMISYSN